MAFLLLLFKAFVIAGAIAILWSVIQYVRRKRKAEKELAQFYGKVN